MDVLYSIYAVIVLLLVFIIFYRIEKIKHEQNIKSIPLRIWVNGTRGKSSVTRLIAAGLRADGKKVIAKTTGTSARFITDDTSEQPVIRLGMANIGEQIKILTKTAQEKPDAVVLECMALRPDLQWTESTQIVQPNAVVITNIRADHLDVMGPTVKDIMKTFIKAIPERCQIFVTKSVLSGEVLQKIDRKNVKIITAEASTVSDGVLKKFSYMEHRENVAVALSVCKYYGVGEKIALKGMYHAQPDPGALRKFTIFLDGREIIFINAMAANDPESTYQIWQSVDKDFLEINLLINCRSDRIDRTFQLANLIKNRLHTDHYILTGSGTDVLARSLYNVVDKKTIYNLGGENPEQVIDKVAHIVSDKSLLLAIGNTAGYGVKMAEEFLKYRKASC